MPQQIHLMGGTNVTVLPRAKPSDGRMLVCHLLNGNYIAKTDSTQQLNGLTITLADSLVPSNVTGATLLAPRREPVSCRVDRNEDGVSISVPILEL